MGEGRHPEVQKTYLDRQLAELVRRLAKLNKRNDRNMLEVIVLNALGLEEIKYIVPESMKEVWDKMKEQPPKPKCIKTGFKSYSEALAFEIDLMGSVQRRPREIKQCSKCGKYHLYDNPEEEKNDGQSKD